MITYKVYQMQAALHGHVKGKELLEAGINCVGVLAFLSCTVLRKMKDAPGLFLKNMYSFAHV